MGPNLTRTYIKFLDCSPSEKPAVPAVTANYQLFGDTSCFRALPDLGGAYTGFIPSGLYSGICWDPTPADSSKFDCSSAPPAPIPQMGVSVTITAYDDTSCNVRSSTFSGAPNPLVTTWNSCTAGPTPDGHQYFVQASSCGINASVAFYQDSSCRKNFLNLRVQGNNTCDSNRDIDGVRALKFVCANISTPPPPPLPPPSTLRH
jgi:hypothetical protein